MEEINEQEKNINNNESKKSFKLQNILIIGIPLLIFFALCIGVSNYYLGGTKSSSVGTADTNVKTHDAYYPTEEEYLEYYSYYFNVTSNTFVKTHDSNTNCTTVTWNHGYSHSFYDDCPPMFRYNIGLFENESGQITWCSSSAYSYSFESNSFEYDFYYRCSDEDRRNIIADVVRGAYILACYHNRENYDYAVFEGLASNSANNLLSGGEYETKIKDCDFYISISDSGIISMLDYGEKAN